jgi:hypothetical protein
MDIFLPYWEIANGKTQFVFDVTISIKALMFPTSIHQRISPKICKRFPIWTNAPKVMHLCFKVLCNVLGNKREKTSLSKRKL